MSRKPLSQTGFSVIEGLLSLIAVVLIVFVGYYVWHAQKQTNATYNSASKVVQSSPPQTTVNSFAACEKASGSKTLETFPEQCVTAAGKTFTDTSQSVPASPNQTLTIKEWGVSGVYTDDVHLTYAISNNGGNPVAYTASVTSSELTATVSDTSCVSGGGDIERAYASTPIDQAGTTGATASKVYTTTKVGDLYYVYIPPQGDCSSNQAVEAQTERATEDVVKTLKANP